MTHIASQRFVLIGLLLTFISMPLLGEEDQEDGARSQSSEREFLGQLLEGLSHETVGPRDLPAGYPPSPQVVTPPGTYALSIDGDFDLGGFVFKDGAPFLHNDGGPFAYNTALGRDALVSSTSGSRNTALGASALYSNTEGRYNTASGQAALRLNTSGYFNTASGEAALTFNTTGGRNTASGKSALRNNSTGYRNTASGAYALFGNTTGNRNTALGTFAGSSNSVGSNNIWIGSYGTPESNTLRIGKDTGTGAFQQNRAFISGIEGIMTGVADAVGVLIDSNGQLGTVNSTRRVKEDIRDMGAASSGLQRLRPVTFRYKKAFTDGDKPIRYGLIAEEVAEVFPELVAYDEEGRPQAVLYHLLDAMLLNEIQKQQAELVELRATKARVEKQDAMLRELRVRLTRLEAAETARGRPVKTSWR